MKSGSILGYDLNEKNCQISFYDDTKEEPETLEASSKNYQIPLILGYHRERWVYGIEAEQLAAVQEGRLEDWELEAAKSTLLNAYSSMGDSQGKLENFYLGQAATGRNESPEELAAQVREVTLERILQAMSTVKLDTVYFLQGK